jgi:hypothetical protein
MAGMQRQRFELMKLRHGFQLLFDCPGSGIMGCVAKSTGFDHGLQACDVEMQKNR